MWPVCSFTTFLIGTLLILLVTLLGIMEPLGQVGGPFTTVVKSIKPACLPSGFCVELLGESFAPWTGVFRHPKLSFGVLMTTLPVTDARAL